MVYDGNQRLFSNISFELKNENGNSVSFNWQ